MADRLTGDVAEWLGKGLQNPVPRFDSGRRLENRDPRGPLAQGESASLTRKRSLVQIQHGPQREKTHRTVGLLSSHTVEASTMRAPSSSPGPSSVAAGWGH